MTRKRVKLGEFEVPIPKGHHRITDRDETTDYLFINGPHETFSMYFERGQKPFEIKDRAEKDGEYCLFQMKRPNRTIHFYCPERLPDRESVMWYFYVEIFDEKGKVHVLPGQIRVVHAGGCLRMADGKTKFIEILENVQLTEAAITA